MRFTFRERTATSSRTAATFQINNVFAGRSAFSGGKPMLVRYCLVPGEEAVDCMSPEAVATIARTVDFKDFADDTAAGQLKATGIRNTDSNVDSGGLLFIAKDKATLLRGLCHFGEQTISSSNGTIVVARGKYSSRTAGEVGSMVANAVPFVAKARMNVAALQVAKRKDRAPNFAQQAQAKNMLNRTLLKGRGYFALVIGRASFTGTPADAAISYVGDYKTTLAKLAALLNHGDPVTYQARSTPLANETTSWWEARKERALAKMIKANQMNEMDEMRAGHGLK